MLGFVDELEIANNVYRTEKYIVTQELIFEKSDLRGSRIESRDVYYERTNDRDALYENVFAKRIQLDGERIQAKTYIRRYVK